MEEFLPGEAKPLLLKLRCAEDRAEFEETLATLKELLPEDGRVEELRAGSR